MEEGAATFLEAKERRDAYCHLLWDRTSLEMRRSRFLKEEAHKIAEKLAENKLYEKAAELAYEKAAELLANSQREALEKM